MKYSQNIKQKTGLSAVEVDKSRREHGTNSITHQKQKSFAKHFFSNMGDPVIRILLCALCANIIFMFRNFNWFETIGIAVSVLLATFISTMSEYGSEAAFLQLEEKSSKTKSLVLRDGKEIEISTEDIVVSDIVLLTAGERIPADGIIIEGALTVDQSSMTGESRPVKKRVCTTECSNKLNPSDINSLLRGCVAMSGSAVMEVRAVGDLTYLGEISREVANETTQSPLKQRLTKLAKQISILGYIAALLVASAYLFDVFVMENNFETIKIIESLHDLKFVLNHLLHAFTLGLTVIVVAVPEGLPMMIAVVLSSNIKKMVRDNVLVRKPVGIESAGSMNILFTDKTGTLTQGVLSVGNVICGTLEEFESAKELYRKNKNVFGCISLMTKYNSSSNNSAETALQKYIDGFPVPSEYNVLSSINFNSKKKYSAVYISKDNGLSLVKGAPEKLLPYIRNYLSADGKKYPCNIVKLEEKLKQKTKKGMRLLLLALCDRQIYENADFPELTLVCVCELGDILRGEARESVKCLTQAGIQLVMITGDNKETAVAIAESCGIFTSHHNVALTSEELATYSDIKLGEILPHLALVARALPTDKSRLVRVAQEIGLVVGMTGDGINDAPALKRADVGFAMGSGSAVAKEAGDIIILDNNLASIAKAVLYGRNVFVSIRKFIVLQLTMNFCAVGVSMICPFIGVNTPVTVVQMLWINIIMDTLGGLAFAGEEALPYLMRNKPKKREEPILNRYMINQIVVLGSMTVVLCIGFLKLPWVIGCFRSSEENIVQLTAFFAMFIFAGVFNCFNARTDSLRISFGLAKNKAFITIMAAVLIIQILFVYLGGAVLRTVPLTLPELLVSMCAALLVFPIDFMRKIFLRLSSKRYGY